VYKKRKKGQTVVKKEGGGGFAQNKKNKRGARRLGSREVEQPDSRGNEKKERREEMLKTEGVWPQGEW